ncbi:UNVERIFIED_CONTAM: hypothetical protein HDU68_006132 [Siphonaria sp. JEL0065]|nr:hypothetical protein HDU68_006132 [Siphonaria sp. JEL0065]
MHLSTLSLAVAAALVNVVVSASNIVVAPYHYFEDDGRDFNLTSYADTTGINHYVLAFVTADYNNKPYWNGWSPIVQKCISDQANTAIQHIRRKLKGDVAIAFGGQAGKEFALVAKDAESLADTYLSVLHDYDVTWADFDIEGATLLDKPSVDLRNKAIHLMQQREKIKVSYTLPVNTTHGLDPNGLYLMQSALKHKVRVDIVNIMAMDYYEDIPYVDSQGHSLMGHFAIKATNDTHNQLQALYKGTGHLPSVGVTILPGINDDVNENITIADVVQLTTWLKTVDFVSLFSFWNTLADSQGGYNPWVDGVDWVVTTPYNYSSTAVSVLNSKPDKSTTTAAIKSKTTVKPTTIVKSTTTVNSIADVKPTTSTTKAW